MSQLLNRRDMLKMSISTVIATTSPAMLLAGNKFKPDDFSQLDLTAQAALLRNREVSALELAEAAIRRIELLNPKINAIITPIFDQAIEKSKKGLPEGPFSGVPFLFKDLLDYKGHRTAYGSRASLGHISKQTHIFGQYLVNAGLNILGKTNTPELGLLATTEPLAFGATVNPWDLSRSAGGSSGGSAAAVASGMVAAAQGGDGGGSIRLPSSCCGLVGLKVSRDRHVSSKPASAGSLSVKGYLTHSVRDSAALYQITEDKSANARYPAIGNITASTTKKLKIGLVMEGINQQKPAKDVEAAILATVKLCESLGHRVVETSFPFDGQKLIDAFLSVWASFAYNYKNNIEKQIGKPADDTLLEPWTLFLADYYQKQGKSYRPVASSYFAEIEANMDKMMQNYDVLLSPVCSTAAPKLGEQGPLIHGTQLIKNALDYVNYTPVYNISGQPAISVPLNWNETGLPIGSQFAASQGNEKILMELAYQLEEAQPWKDKWAPYSA